MSDRDIKQEQSQAGHTTNGGTANNNSVPYSNGTQSQTGANFIETASDGAGPVTANNQHRYRREGDQTTTTTTTDFSMRGGVNGRPQVWVTSTMGSSNGPPQVITHDGPYSRGTVYVDPDAPNDMANNPFQPK
jgi:hypothetical protein